MKLLIRILFIVAPFCGFSQYTSFSGNEQRIDIQPVNTSSTSSDLPEFSPLVVVRQLDSVQPNASDSIRAKRRFISTVFYKGDVKLSHSSLIELYQDVPKAGSFYRQGRTMKTLGLVAATSGLALAYIALKGKQKSITVDRTYDYTVRSVPELLTGLGLVGIGLCLVEFSNESMAKAADKYNSNPGQPRKVTFVDKVKLGITPGGRVGFYACF